MRLDAEFRFATTIHPDSSPIVAPSFVANALRAAELLHQNNNGVWIAQGTVLKAMAPRLASNGIASSLVVLRSGSVWNEKTKEEGREQKQQRAFFIADSVTEISIGPRTDHLRPVVLK